MFYTLMTPNRFAKYLLLLLLIAAQIAPGWYGSTALAVSGSAMPEAWTSEIQPALSSPSGSSESPASATSPANHWNLPDVYADESAWQSDCDRIDVELIPEVEKYQGMLSDPASVQKCLKAEEALYKTVEKVYLYASLQADLDQSDPAASERLSAASSVYTRAATAASYVEPELLAGDPAYLSTLAQQEGMKSYAYYFDRLIQQRAHTLSGPEESLLAAVSDLAASPNTIYTKLTTVDIQFQNIELPGEDETAVSEASYTTLVTNPERDVRKQAYEKLLSGYIQNSHTLAATLEAQVKADVFFARARNYDSSLEAALDSEKIPREVYDNLVDTASQRLDPLHRYVRLRAKLLNISQVSAYDLAAPLVPYSSRQFSFSEGQQTILKGLSPLGSTYTSRLDFGFKHRWVDVYPDDYKTSGAYATAAFGIHPFILMNYDGSYDSVLTLAHEGGHAMYFDCTNRSQPYINTGIPIVTHEVASTANELLVTDYLINQAGSDDEKLFLLSLLADNIVGTFYRQLMYSEFEQVIHARVEQGEGLTPENLNSLWSDLLKKYYGPGFAVDEFSAAGWLRIPHFYYNFYVYKYALDIAAAQHLVQGLESGDAAKVQSYLAFLKAGGSDYPVNVLKDAGVDLADPAMEDALLDRFESTLDEMQTILIRQGKLKAKV